MTVPTSQTPRYDLGETVRITATFRDAQNGNILLDPEQVQFLLRNPLGEVYAFTYGVHPELLRESEGVYYVDLQLDYPRTYWYRWLAESLDIRGVYSGRLYVESSLTERVEVMIPLQLNQNL
jgi:hypothetical protein